MIVGLPLSGKTGNENDCTLSNASSVFETLFRSFVYGGPLKHSDGIILASENHTANVIPWIKAANETGANVLWWTKPLLPYNESVNTCLV